MVKKGHTKKKTSTTHKKHATHKVHHEAPKPTPVTINMPEPKESKIDKMVMENFVSLQKVMTNLSIKLDDLTSQVSKLLQIFEISAKALAEKDFDVEKDNKELLEKMETLIDQNKTLARGVTLMHERLPREAPPMPQPQQTFTPPSMPSFSPLSMQQLPSQKNMPQPPSQMEGFQPSIASTPSFGTKRMSKEITGEEENNTPRFETPA